MSSVVLRVVLACTAASLAAAACPSEDWMAFRGKCYYKSTFKIGGWSISDVCNFGFPGSQAASIHSLDVNTFLAQDVMKGETAWMGLYRKEGDSSFSWMDGTPLDYTYWYTEPSGTDERCGDLNIDNVTGQWGWPDCFLLKYFLCEIDES